MGNVNARNAKRTTDELSVRVKPETFDFAQAHLPGFCSPVSLPSCDAPVATYLPSH